MKYKQKLYEALKLFLSVNNKLCGKLVSLLVSPVTSDERFKVTSAPFFNPDIRKFYI